VLDHQNPERDRRLAQHIVSLYTNRAERDQPTREVLPSQTVKDYIAYARAHVHPIIGDDVRYLSI